MDETDEGLLSREGFIIEGPLLRQFHDPRDVILTSQMVVIKIFSNGDRYIKHRKIIKKGDKKTDR